MENSSSDHTRIAIYIICALLVIAALELAQPLIAPILSAIVIGVVLSPIVDLFCRLGVKSTVAAAATLLLFLIFALALIVALEPSISAAIAQAPLIWAELQSLVELAQDASSGLRNLQESVQDALEPAAQGVVATGDSGGDAGGGGADEEELPIPSLFDALSYGPAVLGAILMFLGTLYFFLASRTGLYRQVARTIPSWRTERLHAAERQVARYFLTITCINATFGILVTVAMMLLGMPQPGVWGIATFLMNFILYLGPAVLALALLIVGLVTFEGAISFAPVAIFLTFNMIEAQFATPTLVGQHMKLNPLLVFLSLIAWLWLWGPVGGLVAIPVLVWALVMFASKYRSDQAGA
ncbi:AI-2E family transporter [Rhodobacterales bacterium HKCCE4037]|nr:AI-2E family transporter [Rhodobacterales bacterium HKCCE4037]